MVDILLQLIPEFLFPPGQLQRVGDDLYEQERVQFPIAADNGRANLVRSWSPPLLIKPKGLFDEIQKAPPFDRTEEIFLSLL